MKLKIIKRYDSYVVQRKFLWYWYDLTIPLDFEDADKFLNNKIDDYRREYDKPTVIKEIEV